MILRVLWRLLRYLPACLLSLLAVGWLAHQLGGKNGLPHLLELRADIARLRAENAALLGKNRQLRAELSLYDDDDRGAIERIARDDLGLVKRGEIVFKVESPQAR